MTVSTVVNHEQYTGNGVTTVFPYRFRILKSTHMVVTVSDTAGVLRTLINGTDYTITGVGLVTGGNVVLSSALADGWLISLDRDLPAVQETDLRNQGRFFAETHEDAFDYLTMLVQRALSLFGLALRKPSWIANYYDALGNRISNLKDPVADNDAVTKRYADSLTEADFIRSLRVPEKSVNEIPGVALRKNMILGFDENGDPKVLIPGGGSAADVLLQLASTEDGKGDALIGVRQPFDGAVARTQHDKNADALNILDFGVIPDSAADQSAAILKAIAAAAGRTLIFPKGTFVAALGTLTTSVNLVGQGHSNTIIKRPASSASGIVFFSGSASYSVKGICFDGNKSNNGIDADNILVASSVVNFDMFSCRSTRAKGKNGITIGTTIADIVANGVAYIEKCRFDNNDNFGAKITKRIQVNFTNNECDLNGDNGLSVENVVFPPIAQSQQRITITNNHLHHNNSAGCFITGYTDGGTAEAPLYGNNNNANYKIIVSNNHIHYNKRYGLSVQVNEFAVTSNICTNNGEYSSPVAGAYAGILINGSNGTITGNTVRNNTGYGMDLGGTQYFTCNDNFVIENGSQTGGGFVGINLGGCQYGTVSSNTCVLNGPSGYGTQILVPGYDGGVTSFPTLTNAINITGNTCILGNASSRVGIRLYGRALNCSVTNNKCSGGNQNTAIAIETNEPTFVSGNNHEDSSTNLALLVIANNAAITFPDFVENVHITGGATNTNFLTYSHNIFRNKVSEAVVINQGSGYNPLNVPAVTISGGGGSGAKAVAAVDGSGKIISVNITDAGSGYTSAPTITIAPPVSGTTATANARIGVINFQGRKWTLFYDTASTIQSGNNIQLPGSTTSLSVPANGVVTFIGTESGRILLAGKSF